MKELKVKLFDYSELSQAAKDVVIAKFQDNEWFDYSDHEHSDYAKSLGVFNSAFNASLGGSITGVVVIDLILSSVRNAARIQAANNKFYADYFEKEYSSKVESVEAAISLIDNCLLTGVCTDFYLLDTIKAYLKGEKYQTLSFAELIRQAKKNARNELNKACRFFKSKKHVHSCLEEQCEDYFFEDGSVVPQSLINY